MKAFVDWNLTTKQYEATPAGAGRPFKKHQANRTGSKRLFVTGATRAEALAKLADALKA